MSVFDPAPAVADPYGDLLDDEVLVSLEPPKKRGTARIVAGIGAVALAALVGAYAFAASSPETAAARISAWCWMFSEMKSNRRSATISC